MMLVLEVLFCRLTICVASAYVGNWVPITVVFKRFAFSRQVLDEALRELTI